MQQDGLTDPTFMRLVNELQHQLIQHALALVRDHSGINDDLLVGNFFKEIPGREHACVARAFDDAIQRLQALTTGHGTGYSCRLTVHDFTRIPPYPSRRIQAASTSVLDYHFSAHVWHGFYFWEIIEEHDTQGSQRLRREPGRPGASISAASGANAAQRHSGKSKP
jgi:hypothetical protein